MLGLGRSEHPQLARGGLASNEPGNRGDIDGRLTRRLYARDMRSQPGRGRAAVVQTFICQAQAL